MSNKRVYDEVQGLVMNGVSVGGVTSIEVEEGYSSEQKSEFDGAQGPTALENAGAFVKATVRTTDITKAIALLISTPGTAEWFAAESGLATFSKASLVAPVFHKLDMRFNRENAVATLEARCRFPASNADIENVHALLAAQTAPTRTHPNRLHKVLAADHGLQGVLHIEDLSVSVAGRLLTDWGDEDIGETAVDVAGFGDVSVNATFKDSSQISSGPGYDLRTALIKNGVKDLVVELGGVAEVADAVMTLRNCKWRGGVRSGAEGYSRLTMRGELQYRDPATPFTIRTINHATAATRLINIV